MILCKLWENAMTENKENQFNKIDFAKKIRDANSDMGIKKIAQVLTSNIYSFVPLQDFTVNSDIDWSKSIPEIDQQLYAKYNLTDEEISFIESMIKPME